jgi:TP901 family phage tail tape measure protein
MADKNIGIALVLSAKNQASQVVDDFFSRTEAKLQAFGQGVSKVGEGVSEMFAAKKGFDFLEKGADAFGDMEQAGNYLKASLMGKGGILDDDMYNKMFAYGKQLSATYTGTTAAYLDMERIMKQNRLKPEDILGGIGEQSAKLAIYFDNMLPAATAEFAAHMKTDMGVAAKEMYGVMDLVARIHDSGVGKTGQEAVDEMNQFFSKTGLGLANLHTQGLEASKQMGALGAVFMSRGFSGQSVGTNFRRILDGIASGDKVKKANEVAAMFHKHLEFFDKGGRFLGIDNFVNQLGKLRGMHPAAIEAILQPFSGKQGLSTDFMQFLANEGLNAYPEMKRKIDQQASLDEKVKALMAGQRMQEKIMQSNITNSWASLGSAIAAPYKQILGILNNVVVAVGKFMDEHPKLAKLAATFIAISSAAIGLMGIIKIIQGINAVMAILNITMAMNPFILIAAAAVAAAVLIYTYWDEIKAFFVNLWQGVKNIVVNTWNSIKSFFIGLWDGIKNIFSRAWDWYKNSIFIYFNPVALIFKYWKQVSNFFSGLWELVQSIFVFSFRLIKRIIIAAWTPIAKFFSWLWDGVKSIFEAAWKGITWVVLNMTPVGQIYQHWKPIVQFFSNLWENVKTPFISIFKWVWGFGTKFFEAGKHIIDSIVGGIMNKVSKVGDTMKMVAQKIRNYLPFSPAKEGALRDIHKVKLIETIADSIRPTALIHAWDNALGGLRGAMHKSTPIPMMQQSGTGGGGVGMNITFAPVIHLNGSATQADATLITNAMRTNFKKMMDDYISQRGRLSF